ncbi:MAG TPA: TetR/AcrR family transcriptional regulator [Candidatus Dormibacteraeota bacterium]|nr:TetR/AcrR family transcriptional regulator [Candidatus Dormibacteraeota bacterium]
MSRPRGRPRQFDYTTALDAALHTFWHRGFTGTSVDHLTAAMRLNRPSLYAAFGSKDAAFAAAMDHYMATVGRDYVQALNGAPTLREGLTAFFAAVIDVATGRRGPTGCAIVCTLPAEAGSSPTVRRQLARALAQVDAAVAARLKTARAAGELSAAADLRAVAQLIAGTMFALAIRARAGAPRRELTRIARTLVAVVTDSTQRTRRAPRPRGESPENDSASARRSLRSLR